MKRALLLSVSLVALASAAQAEIDYTKMPGLIFGGMMGGTTTNLRTEEHMAWDANQHPIMMLATFGGLRGGSTFVEVLPTNTYWSEYIGGLLTAGNARGKFIGAADQSDQKLWDELSAANKFQASEYSQKNQLVAINYDSLAEPGTADMVLLSKKMGQLMAAGNLEKLLGSAYKSLKPGGALLVEDYHATNARPQDPKGGNGYIRKDWAVATIKKAGFTLENDEDNLLGNPNDPRTTPMPNSDRFLLLFRKPK